MLPVTKMHVMHGLEKLKIDDKLIQIHNELNMPMIKKDFDFH